MGDKEQNQSALSSAAALFRAILEKSLLGGALVEAHSGKFCVVNQPFAAIFGRPSEELIGCNWIQFTHPDDLEADCDKRSDLLAGKIDSFSREKRYLLPNGSAVWANVTIIPIRRIPGNPIEYLIAIAEDISERKSEAHQLQQANERVALAERAAKAGIWDWDMQTGAINWSPALYELFGLPANTGPASFELWRGLLHPEDKEEAENTLLRAIQNRSLVFNPYRIILPDGRIRWINSYGDITYDASGVPIRMTGFCIDTTEYKKLSLDNVRLEELLEAQRKTETKLQVSEHRLELALSASGLGLWDYSIPSGDVIYDQRWCKILGYLPGEVEAKIDSWKTRVHPEDISKVEKSVAAHLNGEIAIHQTEHRLRHKEGHWVWILASGKVAERDAEGNPVRIVGTMLDISSRKRISREGTDLMQRIESLLREVSASPFDAQPSPPGMTENSPLDQLSRRHRQTLVLIAEGFNSAEIAVKLNIAKATAITHRRELMRKLNLHSAAEVARFAIKHKLISA